MCPILSYQNIVTLTPVYLNCNTFCQLQTQFSQRKPPKNKTVQREKLEDGTVFVRIVMSTLALCSIGSSAEYQPEG